MFPRLLSAARGPFAALLIASAIPRLCAVRFCGRSETGRKAGRPGAGEGTPKGRRIRRGAEGNRRAGRQSRVRLARPAGGRAIVAGRPRHGLPPSRPLRPLRLPERARPGLVPLSDPARQRHRSEGGRQPKRARPGLLDQSGQPGATAGAGRGSGACGKPAGQKLTVVMSNAVRPKNFSEQIALS